MTYDQKLAVADPPALTDVEPYSAGWWQLRTAEELRDIIKRGFSGGDVFHGAVSEAERRAREETRRLREAAAAEADRKKRRRLLALSAVAAASVATSAGLWVLA